MATLYPTLFAQPGWFSTSFLSARLGIPLRTIQHWCQVGFFAKRGCPVIHVPNAKGVWRRGQLWVYIPPTSKDSLFKPLREPISNQPSIYASKDPALLTSLPVVE